MKHLAKLADWLLLLAGVNLVILGLILLFTPLDKLSGLTGYLTGALLLAGLAELLVLYRRSAGPWLLASGLGKVLAPAGLLAGGLIKNWLAVLLLLATSLQLVAAHYKKDLLTRSIIWPARLAVLLALPLVLRLLSGQLAVFCSGLLLIATGLGAVLLFFSLSYDLRGELEEKND